MARRKINRLSTRHVAKVRAPGYHADGDGLYLQVSDALTKSWIFRYALNGRPREMGLGRESVFTLHEARERAQAQRKLLADGIDPIDHRDTTREELLAAKARERSFEECAQAYVKAHREGWRSEKHGDQWEATLATYCGAIWKMPVNRIETAHIVKVLEPIWTEKPETASRLRARIERVLARATVSGFRTGDNPARWRGHLKEMLPNVARKGRVKHHPALPFTKMGAFMEELRAVPGSAARALEFAILTAARTSEVIGAKPSEVDFDESVWVIPASRMKAGREHRIPLSARAVEIAREAIKAGGKYVFPGRYKGEPLSNMAMLQLLRRTHAGVVPHGFRSTFRTWAAEKTSFARGVCEAALAHVVQGVEGDYQRGDLLEKRRKLMQTWATYCATTSAGKVTPIRKSA